MNKEIGDRVKKCRAERGLTQMELAALMGYRTKSSICRIETGSWRPAMAVIEKLAAVLECSPQYLLGWTGTDEPAEELIRLIGELNTDQQLMLLEYVRFLLSKNQ